MASYHCSVKVGGRGKAASHAAYIAREGKYSGRERYEDLEATGHGQMPAWAAHNPAHFWNAADEHERANGATYREIEVALPRELDPAQRRELVEDFIRQELGERHAYQWAIHTPKAALEGQEQPHAHIMYSERTRDSIERDPAQYFKRYNAKAPERGGCRKDSAGTVERLQATRERWASVQNAHLERCGHVVRVDHRSLAAQGIERAPERHLGGRGVRRLQKAEVSGLLERRAAEGELERAQQQVSSLIDLSGDLAAAKAERARQTAEAALAAQQAAAELVKRQAAPAPLLAPMPEMAIWNQKLEAQERYTQALDRVTNETLATVPGLLPPEAVLQALHQVGQEVRAEAQRAEQQVRAVDLDAIRRQVLAQPDQQRRLEQAKEMDEIARATLESVAGMGVLKRMVYDTKAMTAEAQRLQRAAQAERTQVKDAVEQSPELREGRRVRDEGEQALHSASYTLKELGEMQARSECGQALWQPPKHVYRVPETVTRVLEVARAMAPKSVPAMSLAEVQRMAERAAEVVWMPKAGNPIEVAKSRFVLPAEERRQQQRALEDKARSKTQDKGQDYSPGF